MSEIIDIGEVEPQRLLDGGLNVFAVDLLGESYVRDVLPAIKTGVRFTVQVRKESGKPETVPVRFTIEPADLAAPS